ncbi:unnamed protein product [Adineta steineri]|uniref:Fringe-like glycosyltransferase domain-containing protein n=1 Tax=Adineta steineri TaxID=433720 RepID=A0A814EUS0_9BILA|nr:unnamed protein product [Adineta steineri]CAF1033601.1 unnamed protein product [Adineta steineri]CAF3793029.1 unnamed protein product [Adineta steineri]CAF3891075.1 unnamed protein product [Adineta steineri]
MYLVRTVSKYHSSRLVHLLETWISLVHEHVYYISDTYPTNITRTHVIATGTTCGPSSHGVRALCCQTIHDFIFYRRYESQYDWFCHFDDDQYVHTDNLHEYLSKLDSNYPYYIGRNSWNTKFGRKKNKAYPGDFWFATLGAGVCLSKRTLHLLEPYTRTASQFVDGCLRQWYPDDIYLAFILNNHLNISLTKNLRFHSHLEGSLFKDKQEFIDTFHQQITFGFGLPRKTSQHLPNLFSRNIDPLRMRTLHCLLHTHFKDCQSRIKNNMFNITK